jgi:general secretion pathway protein L
MVNSVNQTLLALRTSYLAPAIRRLNTAWHWWTEELSAFLPENLRQFIEFGNQRLIIAVTGDEFVVQHGSAGQLQEIGRIPKTADGAAAFSVPDNIRETVLLLSQDQVLTCAVTLPLAAEENLREVLSFEMDRHTPFAADDVYYDFAVTGRSSASKTLSLLLFVAPRHIVDEFLATMTGTGITPDVVAAHPSDNPDGHVMNLIPACRRSKRDAVLKRLNASLATLAVLLFATAIALPIVQKNQAIDLLQAQVQTATAAAQTGNQLMREVEKLVDGSNYLVNKKQTDLTAMKMLDEMTRLIPDNTWINRIDLNDGEIQLQGQSGSAAGLIALIEASPMFHNVRFRSPVTQVVRTEQERFHLSAETLPRLEE